MTTALHVLSYLLIAFLAYCLGGLRMYERGAREQDAIYQRRQRQREGRVRDLLARLPEESSSVDALIASVGRRVESES